jgi:hypothetical protein
VPLANHPHRRRPIGGKSAPASVLAVEKKFERFEAFHSITSWRSGLRKLHTVQFDE